MESSLCHTYFQMLRQNNCTSVNLKNSDSCYVFCHTTGMFLISTDRFLVECNVEVGFQKEDRTDKIIRIN